MCDRHLAQMCWNYELFLGCVIWLVITFKTGSIPLNHLPEIQTKELEGCNGSLAKLVGRAGTYNEAQTMRTTSAIDTVQTLAAAR